MATCSRTSVMAAAVDYNTFSPHALRVAQVGLLIQILKQSNPMADTSRETIMAAAVQYNGLSEQQLAVATVQLLCEVLNAGGAGTGAAEVFSGTADPTDDPGVASAVYYRTDNGAVWTWNETTGSWNKILAA